VNPSPSPSLIDVAANTSAPWWGVPVIAGSFLVIGAALGFAFNWLLESRKAKREDKLRWHELVRKLSAEIFAHGSRLYDLSREDADLRSLGLDDSIPIKAQVVRALSEEKRALANKANELAIIVPKSFNRALLAYVRDARDSVSDNVNMAREAIAGLRGSRAALMAEVRSYLGLPSDSPEKEKRPM